MLSFLLSLSSVKVESVTRTESAKDVLHEVLKYHRYFTIYKNWISASSFCVHLEKTES